MEDDEHYVDDPNNPQFHHHGGEYAYQGGNSGGDFEGEGIFQGDHEGYEASGQPQVVFLSVAFGLDQPHVMHVISNVPSYGLKSNASPLIQNVSQEATCIWSLLFLALLM